jgi:HKD family nuclease
MPQAIMLSGPGGQLLKDELHATLCEMKPRVVGVASAFVSSAGIEELRKIVKACGDPQCRLIAGIDKSITHPEALVTARDLGWITRLGKQAPAVFHPKLLIAGHEVTDDGTIRRLCCVYVGSSNLTSGGLSRNTECGFLAKEAGCPDSAAIAFANLWNRTVPATDDDIRDYAARFAEAARRRKAAELDDLGINDTQTVAYSPADLRALTPPDRPAVGVAFATAAWAGCQSFTGEYRFQLEFPKAAGVVVSQLLSLDGT